MRSMLRWSALVAVHLAGCSSYPGLFFTEHTHVGAQIKLTNTGADTRPLKVNIGYDRGLLAVVPRTKSGENAGSVISKTDLDIVLATNSIVKNVFATGVAAKNITSDPERVEALFGKCRASATMMEDRRSKAYEKLKAFKDDKTKLKTLFKRVFPKRKVPLSFLRTASYYYEQLHARLADMCDLQRDLDVLTIFEGFSGSS